MASAAPRRAARRRHRRGSRGRRRFKSKAAGRPVLRRRQGGQRRVKVLSPLAIIATSLTALVGVALFSLLLWTAAPLARQLNYPGRQEVLDPPAGWADVNYRPVQFRGREVAAVAEKAAAVLLQGWFLPAGESNKSVILVHDYGANRHWTDQAGFTLAPALVEAGYNVLMFDLRNHGRSQGAATTLGQNEVADVAGAVAYLQGMGAPGEQVALLGVGMGATTSLLAADQLPAVKAVVAEGAYLGAAPLLRHQLHTQRPLPGFLPAFPFQRLLEKMIFRLANINPAAVDGEAAMAVLTKPVLLIHGQDDATVPVDHGSRLAAAADHGAELWLVPQAGHGQVYSAVPEQYLHRLLTFLDNALGAPP